MKDNDIELFYFNSPIVEQVQRLREKEEGKGIDLEGDVLDITENIDCLLYTSDAADDTPCVDLGGRRIIKKNFFKQKTAYEIVACLVGSEMCIRDRYR